MRISNLFFLLFALFLLSCGEKKETPSYHKGTLAITTDESFQSITQALAEGYMINYPNTQLTVKTQKEDMAFLDLLKGKNKVIVMSRKLSDKEVKEYERIVDMKLITSNFAADAVVFIVPKNSPRKNITLDEIKEGLLSTDKLFIFDQTNSSNLNFVAQKINKKPSELNFSVLDGTNKSVINDISKFPDRIGVIALNTISRPYDKNSQKLKESVKILPIVENGKEIYPEPKNLINMQYPLTRILYFITDEANFGIANGFIRFSCTHLGQMIVQKEGLQKYNLYKREVQMR